MSKKPSVCFIALSAFSAFGGMQRFNQRVIKVLHEDFPELALNFQCLALRDSVENIPEHLLGVVLSFSGERKRFFHSALKAAKASGIVILDHINLLPIAWIVKIISPKTKIILFCHGIEVWNAPGFRKKRFYEPYFFRCIDIVVTVSHFTADAIKKQFRVPSTRIRILPNAVDGTTRSVSRCNNIKPIILVVSRLGFGEESKNVDKLIRSLPYVRKQLADVRIEIIGDGALKEELKQLATQLDQATAVDFLGKVTDEELDAAYARASIFALPSTKEGFGIVYLEAWLNGLPVIGANAGAAPEVISDEEDGILVDPLNIEEIASAICRLVTDEELRYRMATMGQLKLKSFYLHRHFSEKLAGFLVSLSN